MKKSQENGTPAVGAGRPRSEDAQRAVLDAAYGILVERGLAKFSVDAVSTRSGVARTTIARWWPTKGLLAMESFLDVFRGQLVYAVTSDPIADFRQLLDSLARVLSGPVGIVAASVVAQAQSDIETRRVFLDAFSSPLRKQSSSILQRGITEGVLREDLDIAVVLDASVGAVYMRLLLGQPIDAIWSSALSDTVVKGCLKY